MQDARRPDRVQRGEPRARDAVLRPGDASLKAQAKGPLTTPGLPRGAREVRGGSRAREGIDACSTSTGSTRSWRRPAAPAWVIDLVNGDHFVRRQLDARRGRGLPEHHRAGGLRVRPAGGALVLRPGLERARAGPARLRLRAGDPATASRRASCAPPSCAASRRGAASPADFEPGARTRCVLREPGARVGSATIRADDRADDQALRDRGAARQGRHGRRLPGPRHAARPPGRAQAPAAGVDARRRSARQRFLQEARAASAVNHPAIAQIYDVDEGPRASSSPWSWSRARRSRRSIQARELDLLGALEIALAGGGRACRRPTRRASSTATSSPRT